ncbi:hypothetical protein M0R04_12195 [Candidatus Dojkabacteria bacterium]|jgi:hypothetical protein|nr:hypothetical protein [Candidatus Dojkabacteria bacterium]
MEATPTTYNPTKGNSGYYQAVANKVKADYLKDTLASQKQQGVIDDQTYLTKLTDLANQYANGTGINMGLLQNVSDQRTSTAEAEYDALKKQSIEGTITPQQFSEGLKSMEAKYSQFGDLGRQVSAWRVEQGDVVNQQKYAEWTRNITNNISLEKSKAEAEYQQAQMDLGNRVISDREFKAIAKKHDALINGLSTTVLPSYNDWLTSGGEGFARKEKGQRQEKLSKLFQNITGKKPADKIEKLAGGYLPLGFVEQRLKLSPKKRQEIFYYGQAKNPTIERTGASELATKLGRFPTQDEIYAYRYGKYPVELIKAGTYNPKKKYK